VAPLVRFPCRHPTDMNGALSALPLAQQYEICLAFVTTGGDDKKGTGLSNIPGFAQNERLDVYKHFKQVSQGDVQGDRPDMAGALWKCSGNPIAAAEMQMKYDAWLSVKGMSKDDAMTSYVKAVVEQCDANNRDEVLTRFVAASTKS